MTHGLSLVLWFPTRRPTNPFSSRPVPGRSRPVCEEDHIRYVVIVDGEHYPPVVEAAFEEIRDNGHEVLLAVMAGGTEKIPAEGLDAYGDVEVMVGDDVHAVLRAAIDRADPDGILDLSDEPVLDYRRRFALASVALDAGVAYEGADFAFTPPPLDDLATKPSIAIIGTGKRTGKTAVAGFAARSLVARGRRPIVVAMGRGGPREPEVMRGDQLELTPEHLLELADDGKHAASDYIEDAFLSRVPTVGCRRCGGGLAGAVGISNVGRGVEIANELEGDIILLEGSGSAIPPVAADVTCLVVPASIPEEYLQGYFGTYRLLLSDLVMVTMCEEPFGSPSKISDLESLIRSARRSSGEGKGSQGEIRVVRTVFRPTPTRSVAGTRVFVATTAPEVAGPAIRQHLEQEHGCSVVGISHSLSNRAKLEEDLAQCGGRADVLLCEIKAAAIDVATRKGQAAGMDVVYMDNVPVGVEGDDPEAEIVWAGEEAFRRSRR